MIRLEGIKKTFETKDGPLEVLKGVDLTIRDGEIYGIIGFSGAGKSTLIRTVNLLERPTEGKVFLDDICLTDLSPKVLRKERRRIGMIFQQFQLFPSRTVFENVAFPLRYTGRTKAEITDKVEKLLELVDLSDKKGAYPSELSGGQKQRVAIARALTTDPEVLLSDEATSALEPQTTKSVLKLLKRINTELGVTIILVTHEMDVIKEICDRVGVMEKGEIVEEGDVFSIFSNPQADITKNFVESTMNLSVINDLIAAESPLVELSPGECILRLRYLEKTTSEPLVSDLSRKYGIVINILFANVEIIRDHPVGGLVALVGGPAEQIGRAIQHLKSIGVGVEVIRDNEVLSANCA